MAATGIIPWLLNQFKNTPGFAPAGALDLAPGLNQVVGQEATDASKVEGGIGNVAQHGLAQDATAAQSIGGAVQHALYNPGPAPAVGPTTNQTSSPQQLGPNQPTGPMGPGAQVPIHNPAYDPLTYQQIMNKSIGPMIRSLGQEAGTSAPQINSALAPYQQGVPSSVGEQIASTMQAMTSDYQQGLSSMLKYSGQQPAITAILKGMSDILAFPVSGLLGQQGAPPGVEGTPFLQQLYATLNQERSGTTPSTSTASTTTGYNNPNAVNAALAGIG